MLQRIQTVYLLMAIAAMTAFLFAPVIRYEAPDVQYVRDIAAWDVKPFAMGYFIFLVAILEGVAMGFSLIAVFLFKQRGLQMGFCLIALLVHLAATAYIYFFFQTKETPIDILYTWWNLAAIPPAVFLLLAYMGIKKDEALVKSMDRLRD